MRSICSPRRFPAGTLVGAPKVRAMQLIAELEPTARGLYGGTVGYFAKNGNMDQAITIRTMVFDGEEYSFQAGGGIVADSVTRHGVSRSARQERDPAPGPRARRGGSMSVAAAADR